MADNFAFTPGSGGLGAADDVGGVLYPRVKVTWGVDASAVDTSATNPLPISLKSTGTTVKLFTATEYETVAASQTAQALGATGAIGDYIAGILVIPATTSPGVVTLLDDVTSIPVFVGGASSVSNLVPFFIPLGMASVGGAWKITTGANVSAIGIGDFT